MGLVVQTLSERIFEIVREQIVSGELREEVPIRQDSLAAELGVSRSTLYRELRKHREGAAVEPVGREG